MEIITCDLDQGVVILIFARTGQTNCTLGHADSAVSEVHNKIPCNQISA